MKQSPKLPAEKRQAQLIRAAGKLFMKKGYALATTEAIAHEAGLTKGALYFHFKSKEDIFFAVVRDISNSYQNNVLSILDSETDAEKAILKMIKAAFSIIKKQKYLTLDLWQKAHRVKQIRDYLENWHRDMQKKAVTYLENNTNMTWRESTSFFSLIHTLFYGIVVQQIVYKKRLDLDRFEKDIIGMAGLYLRRN